MKDSVKLLTARDSIFCGGCCRDVAGATLLTTGLWLFVHQVSGNDRPPLPAAVIRRY